MGLLISDHAMVADLLISGHAIPVGLLIRGYAIPASFSMPFADALRRKTFPSMIRKPCSLLRSA